jgi:hypothetical protein
MEAGVLDICCVGPECLVIRLLHFKKEKVKHRNWNILPEGNLIIY